LKKKKRVWGGDLPDRGVDGVPYFIPYRVEPVVNDLLLLISPYLSLPLPPLGLDLGLLYHSDVLTSLAFQLTFLYRRFIHV